jgi:hypothetical protein
MAIGRAERRVNLGILVLAALLLDFVLWVLVLLGWESAVIPADFNTTHQPYFVFPYSHGLPASIAWSVLAGAAAFLWYSRLHHARLRIAAFVSAAVFSHWLLDALVHAPELPIAGANSAKVGLWLWQDMPLALTVEACIAVAGLCFFVFGSSLSPAKKLWLSALSLLTVASTVVGMTVAPAPPSVVAMAASSLITIVVVSALAGWLGNAPA